MWPVIFSLISVIYGILNLLAFIKRKVVIKEFIDCTDSDLKPDSYFRVMCFSCVELTIALPLGLYLLVHEAIRDVEPWISWEDTHSNFDHIA